MYPLEKLKFNFLLTDFPESLIGKVLYQVVFIPNLSVKKF